MVRANKEKTKLIVSWCLYDWANSCFSAVILTFVFSAYFTQSIAPSALAGTAYWSLAITIAGIVIAILAPFVGCWLTQIQQKKAILISFTMGCILATGLLFFSKPSISWLWYALVLVAIAEIFYELALIVYNSLLLLITTKTHYGRISGWGWGAGYIGGLFVLALCLFVIKSGWLSAVASFDVRLSTLICAVWFFVFSLPLFMVLPARLGENNNQSNSLQGHLKVLRKTFSEIVHRKKLFWLMLTRLFVMDGLNTLFAFGGIVAAGTFGFSMTEVLLFAILLNLTAGIGAIFLGWIDDLLSPLFVIIFSLVSLVILVMIVMFTYSTLLFWLIGAAIGFFVGPVQSSTRSFLAHQIMDDDPYRFFGFYSFSGRISAFIGPMVFGLLVAWFHSQRAGMVIVWLMLALGLCCALRILSIKESV